MSSIATSPLEDMDFLASNCKVYLRMKKQSNEKSVFQTPNVKFPWHRVSIGILLSFLFTLFSFSKMYKKRSFYALSNKFNLCIHFH